MKQLICPDHETVELIETAIPTIGQGELLVRMNACGICGTDLMKVYSRTVAKPVQIGHEVVATIEQVGDGVANFEQGQRVAIAHHIPDYSSHYSRRGSGPMDACFKHSNIFPGGFAQFIRLTSQHVQYTTIPIPKAMSDTRALFMEPLACCLRALDRVTMFEGDSALVVGVGATGLLFVPLLRDKSVIVLVADLRAVQLDLAATWGAKAGFLAEKDDVVAGCRDHSAGRGVDLVILTVINHTALTLAVNAVRDGGTILLFGAKPGAAIPISVWDLWRREINLISSYSTTPDLLPRAMAILSRPEYLLEKTISHTLSLDDAPSGFELLHKGEASKVIITN